jgi:hypothetical protein
MEGIRIARRFVQKFPIKRFGVFESSGPMMFEGDGQFSDRHRVAVSIGAITAACHVASIPPPVREEV